MLVEGWRFGGGGKLSGAVIVAGNGAGKRRGIHDNRAKGRKEERRVCCRNRSGAEVCGW